MCCTNEGYSEYEIASCHNILGIYCAFDWAQDLNGIRREDGGEPLSADFSDAVMMRERSTRSHNLVSGNGLQFLVNADGIHDVHRSIVEAKVKINSCTGIVYLCNSGGNKVVWKLSSYKLNKRMTTIDHRSSIKFVYQCILVWVDSLCCLRH